MTLPMMQTTSNTPVFSRRALLIACSALAFLAVCMAPARVSAFSLPSLPSLFNGATNPVSGLSGVCLRVGALEGEIQDRVKAATAKYDKRADERLARAAGKLSANAHSRALRAETDTKLSAYFKTLEAKGSTPQKRQAIADFRARVVKASNARREAIDAASKTYLDGVTAVYRGRAERVRTLALEMRGELSAVLLAAEGRCRSGADASVVRTELGSALGGIEQAYAAKLNDRNELEAALSALAAARTEAIAQANAAFTAELNASSQSLSAVLQ